MTNHNQPEQPRVREIDPADDQMMAEVAAYGPLWQDDAPDSIGRTMFDLPNSEDNSITVLLPKSNRQQVPAQSLLRIVSKEGEEEHHYIGVIVAGPFAEPDGLRGDTNIIVTTTVHGGIFMPQYHCRCQVEIMGEEIGGTLRPPQYRPLPNSPVYPLTDTETAALLKASGDIRLGLAVGHAEVEVGIPTDKKSVLPRHTGIFGTTGSGKSTTVAGLIAEAQRNGFAVIVLDVEGEYTCINQPTDDPTMQNSIAEHKANGRPLSEHGVSNTHLYHLVGRDTANPKHPRKLKFSLMLENISPYTLAELADFNDAQSTRYWGAYGIARTMLRRLGVFPRRDIQTKHVNQQDEQYLLNMDEFEIGYPAMTLAHLYDVVVACVEAVGKKGADEEDRQPRFSEEFKDNSKYAQLYALVEQKVNSNDLASHLASWLAIKGKLAMLLRTKVFDNPNAPAVDYNQLLASGRVSIFDLSDTNSTLISNLVIADLLRGVQSKQDELYQQFEKGERESIPKVMIIIEEAHEFLSEEREGQMSSLFTQVARIAKRGRKRWLSLVFVTQLPQQLRSQLFGLINNYILHKINDAQTISRLQKVVAGVDEATWRRMPALAPGQAVVSLTSMTRPLLTAIDPAPCKLRMVE